MESAGSSAPCDAILLIAGIAVAIAYAIYRVRMGATPQVTEWQSLHLDEGSYPPPLDPADLSDKLGRPVGFPLIQADDPEFTVEEFYSRIAEMFVDLQAAAASRDLTEAAHYVDGTAFKALQAQVRIRPHGVRAELTLLHARAVAVRRDAGEDLVHVMVTASSPTEGIDPVTSAPLTKGEEGRFIAQEYWTLVRTVGARTLPDASIHRCPNCGGPITAATRAECGYCGTRLCDQNRDWVVRSISAQ